MTDTIFSHDEGFREALAIMGDPNRLLPGEEPATRYVDDALHWEAVYRELLHFKDQLLATASRAGRRLRRDGHHEVSKDLALLKAERSRLHERHRFWSRRVEHLGAD